MTYNTAFVHTIPRLTMAVQYHRAVVVDSKVRPQQDETNSTERNVGVSAPRPGDALLEINTVQNSKYPCNTRIRHVLPDSLGGRSGRSRQVRRKVLRRDRAQRVRGGEPGGDDGQHARGGLCQRGELHRRADERCRLVLERGGVGRRWCGRQDGRRPRGSEVHRRRGRTDAMAESKKTPGVLAVPVAKGGGPWLAGLLTRVRDCRMEWNKVGPLRRSRSIDPRNRRSNNLESGREISFASCGSGGRRPVVPRRGGQRGREICWQSR
jgi:hypothetical protein